MQRAKDYIIGFVVTSSVCIWREGGKMLRTRFVNSERLEENDLFYVHCTSKNDFMVCPCGLPCVEMACREIHFSFIDEMAVRRLALIPADKADRFEGAKSPALIRLNSSCSFTVSYQNVF